MVIILFICNMNLIRPIDKICFDGNNLCLDFINSIHNRKTKPVNDYITDQTTWLIWLSKIGLKKESHEGNDYHFDIHELRIQRELLYHLFYNLIHSIEIAEKNIGKINRLLSKYKKATQILIKEGKPKEVLKIDTYNLNDYILYILKSAEELLLSEAIDQVKECSNCGWLFLDNSKNKKRKWCSMKTCGNEVKAKNFYRRSKQQQEQK